jgi:hypothetical protein
MQARLQLSAFVGRGEEGGSFRFSTSRLYTQMRSFHCFFERSETLFDQYFEQGPWPRHSLSPGQLMVLALAAAQTSEPSPR